MITQGRPQLHHPVPAQTTTAPSVGRRAEKPQHLGFADVVRAGAIYLIFVTHLIGKFPKGNFFRIGHVDVIGALSILSNNGVTCLFILSGYLLTLGYARAFAARAPLPSVRDFYRRRFLRIYPLYAAAVLAVAAAALLARIPPHTLSAHYESYAAASVVSHLTFFNTFNADYFYSLESPLWTMTVDVSFYVLLPLIAAAVFYCAPKNDDGRRYGFVFGVLAALCAGACVFRAFMLHAVAPATLADSGHEFFYFRNIFGSAPIFAAGALLALLQTKPHAPKSSRTAAWDLSGALSAFVVITVLISRQPHDATHMNAFWKLWWCARPLLEGAAGFFMLRGLAALRSERWLGFANGRVVGNAAALSYAFYLFHLPIMESVLHHVEPLGLGARLSALLVFALTVPIVLIVAYPFHIFVEQPFLNRKSSGPPSPPASTDDIILPIVHGDVA